MPAKTTQRLAKLPAVAGGLARVLAHIDAHLDEPLDGACLSRVAAMSRHHFHRRFAAAFGVSVLRYVRLRRLKRAAWQLAFRRQAGVAQIALACGYDGPEAFARAFRRSTGQSPSAFRRQPQWRTWHAAYDPLMHLRSTHMQPSEQAVRIVDFPATRVAALEHRGDPRLLGETIARFVAWRKAHGLPPRLAATYNIAWTDPARTPPADYRMDLCVATAADIADDGSGMVAKTIPPGRCAVLRHVGSDDLLGLSAQRLVRDWLPASGEARGDFPLFFQRVAFFPDVPENEAVVDLFLPLAPHG
jgi:AraC family transcriptional regulator